MTRLEELWHLVRQIPAGKVASYGQLGAELSNPTSGRIVGRWMAQCPQDVPWWRVVASSGALPISKRDAWLGMTQQQALEEEGVTFENGCVDMRQHRYEPG